MLLVDFLHCFPPVDLRKDLQKCTRQGQHLSEMSFQGQIAVVGYYEEVFQNIFEELMISNVKARTN